MSTKETWHDWNTLFNAEIANNNKWQTVAQIVERYNLSIMQNKYLRQRFLEGYPNFCFKKRRIDGIWHYKIKKGDQVNYTQELWRKALNFKPTSTSTVLKKAA